MNTDLLPHSLMLSDAFEGIQDAVYVKDLDGRYLVANAAAAAVAGLDRDRLVGKLDREIFPDNWRDVRAADERVAKTGTSETFEETVVANGVMRIFLSTKAPLNDAAGVTLGIIGISTDITERVSTETSLREREAMLAEAQSVAKVAGWTWDFANDEATWSDELYQIFGVDPEDTVPSFERFLDILHPDDSGRVSRALEQSIESGTDYESEFRVIRPDGEERVVLGRARVVRDSDGRPVRLAGAAMDVTDRRRSNPETSLATLLTHGEQLTRAGSVELDPATGRFSASKGFRELFGLGSAPEDGDGVIDDLLAQLHPDDRARCAKSIEDVAAGRGPERNVFRLPRRDGVRCIEAEMRLDESPGHPGGRIVCGCRDVTEHRAEVSELRGRLAEAQKRAMHDPLTGLPNRSLAFDRLDHAFELAQRRDDDLVVLFMDIDDFKSVNDRFGHGVGDEVLIGVADRLRRSARGSDTVARIGGDEILVVCESGSAPLEGHEAAERFIAAFRSPLVCASAEVRVTLSVGVSSIGGRRLKSARQLVTEADDTMYEAKRSGPGGYAVRSETPPAP